MKIFMTVIITMLVASSCGYDQDKKSVERAPSNILSSLYNLSEEEGTLSVYVMDRREDLVLAGITPKSEEILVFEPDDLEKDAVIVDPDSSPVIKDIAFSDDPRVIVSGSVLNSKAGDQLLKISKLKNQPVSGFTENMTTLSNHRKGHFSLMGIVLSFEDFDTLESKPIEDVRKSLSGIKEYYERSSLGKIKFDVDVDKDNLPDVVHISLHDYKSKKICKPWELARKAVEYTSKTDRKFIKKHHLKMYYLPWSKHLGCEFGGIAYINSAWRKKLFKGHLRQAFDTQKSVGYKTPIHEIGHTLGLRHSSDLEYEYGDENCPMGTGWVSFTGEDDLLNMTLSPIHREVLKITPAKKIHTVKSDETVTLAEFRERESMSDGSDFAKVIIGEKEEIFLSVSRSDRQTGRNKISIHKQLGSSSYYPKSVLLKEIQNPETEYKVARSWPPGTIKTSPDNYYLFNDQKVLIHYINDQNGKHQVRIDFYPFDKSFGDFPWTGTVVRSKTYCKEATYKCERIKTEYLEARRENFLKTLSDLEAELLELNQPDGQFPLCEVNHCTLQDVIKWTNKKLDNENDV